MLKVTIYMTNYAGIDSTEEFETDNMINAQRIMNTYKPTPQKRAIVYAWKVEKVHSIFQVAES